MEMAKRIYTIIAALALVIIIYLVVNPNVIVPGTLLWLVSILYAVLVGSIHGVLGHSLTAKQKGNMIFYPVIIGVSFIVFIFIFIYLVIPAIIPGYMIK